MKIATIIGARPQFIKAAAVSRAISEHNKLVTSNSSLVTEVIVHTGQHYDYNMSDIFFKEMSIPKPDYFLDINSLSHGAMTGQMLEKVEQVLLNEKPEIVLVYGDTNTTIAGALAAVKLHIPVAHVEAGLRSFNRHMPEEINRVVTDHVSTILFCPTQVSAENLANEGIGENGHLSRVTVNSGISPDTSSPMEAMSSSARGYQLSPKVALVGDVMYDSVLHYTKVAEKNARIMARLKLTSKKFGLATIHRAENTDNSARLKSIFMALEKLSSGGLPIIVPLHPRTQKILRSSDLKLKKLKIVDPVSYLEMLILEKQAKVILTDSGGVQKEAFWFKVPCVTLRDETEWVETVESGWNIIVGADADKIIQTALKCKQPESHPSFYGNGDAAKLIVEIIQSYTKQIS